MFVLQEHDITLNQDFAHKQDVITFLAQHLVKSGCANENYLAGMLTREQQNATYLGRGIAIPHGTVNNRDDVLKTGLKVVQIPNGVAWGDAGEPAFLAIGIASRSNEHLQLLKRLTQLLDEPSILKQIKQCMHPSQLARLLNGDVQNTQHKSPQNTLDTNDVILTDLAVHQVSELIAPLSKAFTQQNLVQGELPEQIDPSTCIHLGHSLWLATVTQNTLQSGLGIAVAREPIIFGQKTLRALCILLAQGDTHLKYLKYISRLITENKIEQITELSPEDIRQLLYGKNHKKTLQTQAIDEDDTHRCTVIVRNQHGLHTRPSAVIVKIAKEFNAQILIANATQDPEKFVSAKSLMKIISLGVNGGEKIALKAVGDDAKQAIETLQKKIQSGLE